MSLRTRLLLAFAAVVLIPIALLAFGLRQEMTSRLVAGVSAPRRRGGRGHSRRSRSRERRDQPNDSRRSKSALLNDNRFRLAAVAGVESERSYLLDYAGTAMRLTGLSMLQIQDGDGRIISSGHFRNEHGRVEPGLAPALADARGLAFVTTREPRARVPRACACASRSASAAGPSPSSAALPWTKRFSRGWPAIERSSCRCVYPGGELSTVRLEAGRTARRSRTPAGTTSAVGELQVPLIRTGAGTPLEVVQARLQVTQSLTPLRSAPAQRGFLVSPDGCGHRTRPRCCWPCGSRRGSADRWPRLPTRRPCSISIASTSSSTPARTKSARLSRLLGDLAARLRTSTARVREAERRATVGDLARQINHDIKNGLIPLRNVMRHLAQVERDEPAALPSVFAERRQTRRFQHRVSRNARHELSAAVAAADRRDCDLNALIAEVVRAAQGARARRVRHGPDANLPPRRRRPDRIPAYPRKPDRQCGGQSAVEAGPHHGLDAGGRARERAAGSPGHGRRHRPRDVARRGRTDLQRFLHDEGGRHRSRALHRATAGDGPPRHARRRERARHRDADHHRHSGRQIRERT